MTAFTSLGPGGLLQEPLPGDARIVIRCRERHGPVVNAEAIAFRTTDLAGKQL